MSEENLESALDSPGSRAVAKLARKRATDRRAQWAARQRRQQYIDSLLRQIDALSGLPHDQVHDFFQTNERLRAENEQLRNRTGALLDDRPENGDRASSASSSSPQLLPNKNRK